MAKLDFEDFPNHNQSLVFGKNEDEKRLIYIPKSKCFTGPCDYDEYEGICVEDHYDLDYTQIIGINDKDGDHLGLYLIIGYVSDGNETHVFFGFFKPSYDKYIIEDDHCFFSFSIYNGYIVQERECVEYLGDFTWAICLRNEIRFVQVTQDLLDAFADPISYNHTRILHIGESFDKKIINLSSIRCYLEDDKSLYSIVKYGDTISIDHKIENYYSNRSDIFGQMNIKIDLTNERQFSENFRYSFCVYRHIPEKFNGDTDDADSIDLKLNEIVGLKQFQRL